MQLGRSDLNLPGEEPQITFHKMKSAENEILKTARVLLMNSCPYLSSTLFQVSYINAKNLHGVATDAKGRVYIDFEYFKTLTVKHQAALLYESVNHILRLHHERGKNFVYCWGEEFTPLWNLSCEMELADDLEFISKNLKGGQLNYDIRPEVFGLETGKTAEFYARTLNEMISQEMEGQQTDSDGGQGGGAAGESGESGSEGESKGEGDGGQGQSTGDDGAPSNAPGLSDSSTVQKVLDALDGFNGCSGVMNDLNASDSLFGEGLDDITREYLAERAAREAQEMGQSTPGSVPGGMERWAKDVMTKPTIPWFKVFRKKMRKTIRNSEFRSESTYKRPGRRSHPDFLTPGKEGYVPRAVLAIDTSGSMSGRDLGKIVTEAYGVMEQSGGDLLAFTVDVSVSGYQKVTDPKEINLFGGGGTDMGMAIEKVRVSKEQVDVLIIGTDGDTPWPEDPLPRTKVIALLTDNHAAKNVPSWISTVVIESQDQGDRHNW